MSKKQKQKKVVKEVTAAVAEAITEVPRNALPQDLHEIVEHKQSKPYFRIMKVARGYLYNFWSSGKWSKTWISMGANPGE